MFYIFHGEDSHTKEETLNQLLGKLGDPGTLELNTTRFDGPIAVAALRQVAETIPFLAPARVVIVKDLFTSRPNKDYLAELFEFLPTVPETTRLVFLESKTLRNNHPVILLANQEEQGHHRAYALPKGHQLDRWIQNQVQKKGGEIAPRAATVLASLVGNDLCILDNELEKLVLYKHDENRRSTAPERIEPDDVLLLSPYVAEASIFDLVDALGNRNERAASSLYQRKLNAGADPFYLFSMFVRQFRLLIQVKELTDEGYGAPAVARELKLHNFVAGKLVQQARGFSMQELEAIYRHLLKIDAAVKNGQAEMRTELDLLIANLTLAV